MVQFADVLTQVGAQSAQEIPPGVRVNTSGWDSWMTHDAEPKAPQPSSFYLEAETFETEPEGGRPEASAPPEPEAAANPQSASAPAPERPAPFDLASELAQSRLQLLSDSELRALRRRLARHLHPDAPTADRPNAAAMVRVNVAIDAALRARQSRR